jgi:hypothetical protein
MIAMPFLGAFVGERVPSGSGDYGGSLVKGFALGGAASIGLLLFIRARRQAPWP